MARCDRCCGCRSMYDLSNCPFCNFPGQDIRTPEQIEADNELEIELYNNLDD